MILWKHYMRLLELFRAFGHCDIHIGHFIHVHDISFIRNIRRWTMWSSHWSGWHWARSLVRTVLLIHRVRYTTEFQGVEVYHFPLPGIIDCLDMIGYIANPSDQNVRTLPWWVELVSLPFLHSWVTKEYLIMNLDLLFSNSLIIMVLLTFLGSS